MNNNLKEISNICLENYKSFKNENPQEEFLGNITGFNDAGEMYVLPITYSDHQKKLVFLELAKIIFLAKEVTRYSITTEAYALKGDQADWETLNKEIEELQAKEGSFRSHPLAYEMFMCTVIDHENSYTLTYEIDSKTGKLKESEVEESDQFSDGLFMDLLPDPKVNNFFMKKKAREFLNKSGFLNMLEETTLH